MEKSPGTMSDGNKKMRLGHFVLTGIALVTSFPLEFLLGKLEPIGRLAGIRTSQKNSTIFPLQTV